MKDRWNQLLEADPSTATFVPAEDLLDRIKSMPVDPQSTRRRRGNQSRLFRGALVIIAAIVIGGSVSWAAGGIDPVDRLEHIFGIDRNAGLSADPSGYGLESFSILKPATGDLANELPERLKFWLAAARSRPAPPPPGPLDGSFRRHMIQSPGNIAGWGLTTTDAGERVAVVAMNNKVCLVYDRFHGGSCEPVARISSHGMTITANPGPDQPRTMLGLVDDDVAILRFQEPGYGQIPFHDNVFDVTGLPDNRSRILGLDESGKVVTRIFVSRRIDLPGHGGWMPIGPQPRE